MDASYWVASEGEIPLRIIFNPVVAHESGYTYLDAFDKDGMPLESYKLVDGQYTTSF